MFGAGGRMGSTVCRAVVDDPELELVAAVDPYHAGIDLRQLGVGGAGINVAPNTDMFLDAGYDQFDLARSARASPRLGRPNTGDGPK